MSAATFTDPSGMDRRQGPRVASGDAVKLVTPSGQTLDAVAVDRSLRGLRVELAQAANLPSELTVLSRAQACVYRARVVWRSTPYAGLSIFETVDMRTASDPSLAEVRRLWREHISR